MDAQVRGVLLVKRTVEEEREANHPAAQNLGDGIIECAKVFITSFTSNYAGRRKKSLDIAYDHLTLAVANMDESVRFYKDVMGLEMGGRTKLRDGREKATFHVGLGVLVLYWSPRYQKVNTKIRAGVHHVAFVFRGKHYDGIVRRCNEYGVEIKARGKNSGAFGQGLATYFYDPNGIEIEIKKYEIDPSFKEMKAADYQV